LRLRTLGVADVPVQSAGAQELAPRRTRAPASAGPRETRLRRAAGHWSGAFRAMASPCELLIRTDDESLARETLRRVAAEAWRIEDKFSRYLPGNVVDAINRSAGRAIGVDEETARLLDFAGTLYELSDGRFDISSGVLRKAWTFDGGDAVPDRDRMHELLRHVGWDKADWRRPFLRLEPGMQVDFGGIAKEYAVDSAAILVARHTDSACLINFGGDLRALGGEHTAGAWRVGVESPYGNSVEPARVIGLRHGALATSGDARRYVIHDGVRYGHILDARSGWPARDAPRSVTVAAGTCSEAGMLATLAMLMGRECEAFLDAQSVRCWVARQPRARRQGLSATVCASCSSSPSRCASAARADEKRASNR
ncbi:MAG: FAD:protein FMN transferase, partial [Woeseiaceae bacterium]